MSGMELVPAGEHTLIVDEPDKSRAILLMDSHDLDQAMAELRGEVLASFVYVPKGAKPQLTYAGIKEAARLYRNVHFGATAVPLPDGTWMITSYAHNLADNTRVDYPMPYPAFDPANQEQAIKFRANLSKSLRNALAAVLPVAYLQTMIERWTLQRGGGSPTPAAERAVPRPPARPATQAVEASAVETTVRRAVGSLSQADEREASEPRSAAAWTREQLGAHIREASGLALKTGAEWATVARTHGQPVPTSREAMTTDWLLALYQAMQAHDLTEWISGARDEESVQAARAHALSYRDKRTINSEQYAALVAQADARLAELSSPLLSSSAAQVAS